MHKEPNRHSQRCKMTSNRSSTAICSLSTVLAIVLFATSHSPVFAGKSMLQSMEREFQAIVKAVQPSVVEVVATCNVTAPKIARSENALLADERAAVHCYQNIGSGIIIDSSGRIVTTAAVVENADAIEVVFADGQRTSGELLGVDALTGIAVLSVKRDRMPQAKIGDSDQIDIGSWIITVGSSYGHSPTLSFGTVSGLEILPSRPFYDAIKINAPVNPGNSGGAVVNTSGEIVGVIAATLAEPYFRQILNFPTLSQEESSILHAAVSQGQIWRRGQISFAIPIKTVKRIADQLAQF
ncbi:MAG: trypsin-like peptidase domain-containing protein, partial [Candidatus Poribacteria bacterium]|nr:trypsin-like peptidase domain-containing protein [Candidatus Poribacteria bacterium]